MPKVIILTEAGKGIGFGHLTRCLSLYHGFAASGCFVRFVVNADRSALPLLSGTRHTLTDWRAPKTLLTALHGADIVVVDSYLAGPPVYRTISERVPVPAYLDDNQRLRYPRGAIINGNAHAAGLRYPAADGLPRLIGLKYALLRRPFQDATPPARRRRLSSVLITMGGQDRRNLVPRLLAALGKDFPGLKKRVVIGSSFHNAESIKAAADSDTGLIRSPNAAGMKRLMRSCDIAICAGGQTTNELARLGVPALVVVVAENQRGIARGWARRGAIRYCGSWDERGTIRRIVRGLSRLKTDTAARARMSRLGRRMVDGRGAARVTRELLAAARRHKTRVLFLTNNDATLPLKRWLAGKGRAAVQVWSRRLTPAVLWRTDPEWIVSYGYRFLIPAEILDSRPGRFINLHISLLPWNRGAHPNIWSFLDGTPKGVSIHVIDAGMDTGDILVQRRIHFDEGRETLASSYAKLQSTVQGLFKRNWDRIRNEAIYPVPQKGRRSAHSLRDCARMLEVVDELGWDCPVHEFKAQMRGRA